jgi:DNA-directed RNA polymerase alpha subunit
MKVCAREIKAKERRTKALELRRFKKTLRVIANDLGITVESVRQGIAKAEREERRDKIFMRFVEKGATGDIEDNILPVRAANALREANIHTWEDLEKKSEADLLKLRNFGRSGVNDLKHILASIGKSLSNKSGR